MKKNSKTSTISEILNTGVFGENIDKAKINSIVKQSTIFSFWGNIVGAKFANFTRPYAIKFDKLYVSAKSPVVVQELSLYKMKIIKKVNTYSTPLGFEIKDIVFNYKNYATQLPQNLTGVEDKPLKISQNDLNNVTIPSDLKEDYKKYINRISFLNKSQKEILVSKLINNEKAKIIQKQK